MRSRNAGGVVEWVRDAYDRHGIKSWFIVDDDLYRSPQREGVLNGLAACANEGATSAS